MKLKAVLIFLIFKGSFTTFYLKAQEDSLFFVQDTIPIIQTVSVKPDSTKSELEILKEVELHAGTNARTILETGRKMAFEDKTIIVGSCWTYANAVFKQAGFGKEKYYVFQSKKTGPFVDSDSICPGDWLYYINHSYHNIDHSGIFVCWTDKENKIGLVLSYVGRYRKRPGTYKEYDLSKVFYITRAGKGVENVTAGMN